MTTPTNGGDKEAAPTKRRRKKDSTAKSKRARAAADTFVEHYSKDHSKGAITRAAQAAYPNQSKTSATTTGSRLLRTPHVQELLKKRRDAAARQADAQRAQLVGNLMSIIFMSLDDVLGDNGEINWEIANERGIAHLIQEVDRTERHSKDGSRRVTTKYKLPNKIQAMDLLAELTGWKRERQKNPIESARETYAIMRQDERYRDLPDHELARFPAQRFNVSVAEILEGQPT